MMSSIRFLGGTLKPSDDGCHAGNVNTASAQADPEKSNEVTLSQLSAKIQEVKHECVAAIVLRQTGFLTAKRTI